MKERWMKNDEEWWRMKDADFKLLRGFADGLTDRWTDIFECRVAFVTEKWDGQFISMHYKLVANTNTRVYLATEKLTGKLNNNKEY